MFLREKSGELCYPGECFRGARFDALGPRFVRDEKNAHAEH